MSEALAKKILSAILEGKRWHYDTLITPAIMDEAARILGLTLEQIDFYSSEMRKVSKRFCHINILVAKRD